MFAESFAQPEPVIVLAHGSRRRCAEEVVHAIAREVGARAAFLDFSEFTLDAVVGELRAAGHRRAVVMPLLFTSAFHLRKDVPAAIAEAERNHGVALRATEPIGLGTDVAELLVGQWRKAHGHRAVADSVGDAVVYAVGSSISGANEAVEDLAAEVGRLLGVPARAIFATGGGISVAEHREELGQRAGAQAAPTAVLPLFFAPGLLLDKAVDLPGTTVSGPLGTAIAPLVTARVTALTGWSAADATAGHWNEERVPA